MREQVTAGKQWARVSRVLGLPEGRTDKSTLAKRTYARTLLDFEEVRACGCVLTCLTH